MHMDVPVLKGVFCGAEFQYVTDVYDLCHVPVGCLDAFGRPDDGYLSAWFGRRQIPVTRHNFSDLQGRLHGVAPGMLAMRNFMANLSDQYWIKPIGSDLCHSDVSFFRNDFWFDSLAVLLPSGMFRLNARRATDLQSPSYCTDGDVPKAWALDSDGARVLYKSFVSKFLQEPYNELIASHVLDVMCVKHVLYNMFSHNGADCSLCRCAVSPGQDFVPAYDIMRSFDLRGPYFDLNTYVAFAESVGVSDVRCQIEHQIVLDYLMRNTGRSWFDFGLIRDAGALNYVDVMPIFDNGDSLYHDVGHIQIESDGRSMLTGLSLDQDLQYVRMLTKGMRMAAHRFPGIVQQVLFGSRMPDVRKWRLVDAATYRADRLLRYFGGPGLCCV